MKRIHKLKISIITIILLALICAALTVQISMAADEEAWLIPDAQKITPEENLTFSVNTSQITEEEYGSYDIVLMIDPADPIIDLDLEESIDVIVNKANGTYTINSENIEGIDELHFQLRPDRSLATKTEYTVYAEINGQLQQDAEQFTFTVKPASESSGGSAKTKPADDDDIPEEPVYKGSSNNYLKSLNVSGYKLTQKFDKTRDTYFIKPDKKTGSVEVSAVPEDSKARVDIAGNTNVKRNMSKIVVDVTAQSGDVRVYKIYVRYK